MKRKWWLILAGCLAVSGLLALQVYFAKAGEITLKERLKFDSSVPFTTATMEQDYSNVILSDSDQKTKNEDVLQSAEGLIGKAENTYLVEGWLHIASITEVFTPTSATFPDGSPVPTKWKDDLWVLLDNEGNAVKAVTIQDTGDPATSQVSVFEGGFWKNVTLGFSSSESETYSPTLDSGFLDTILPYQSSVALEEYYVDLNGHAAVMFVATEKYKTPIKIAKDTPTNETKEFSGVLYKFYFSTDTGLPMQVENYFIDPDGNTKMSQQTSEITIERVDNPSSNVLDYFDQK